MADVRQAIREWVTKEMWFWQAKSFENISIQEGMQELAAVHETKFLIEVKGKAATLLVKPAMTNQIWCDNHRETLRRANCYANFISSSLGHEREDVHATLLIDVDDTPADNSQIPIFVFQKKKGERNILLPDIDLLTSGFFKGEEFVDETLYRNKMFRAVFVGSTTGGQIDCEVVKTLSLPRLRSAVFFRGSDTVSFSLPSIVQTKTRDVDKMIEELNVTGKRLTWPEQFRHRFIISIDGNGAACSRLAIGLRSKSVVLKYESQYELCYFHSMRPWNHYIPVYRDEDISDIVNLDKMHNEIFLDISNNSSDFANNYLTEASMHYYTVRLLKEYEKEYHRYRS